MSRAGLLGGRQFGRLADIAGRNDLDNRSGGDGGEALDLQHRLKDRIGLARRHLGRRNDADFAAHAFVEHEILAGDFTDELRQDRNVHVLEVHRDEVLAASARRGFGEYARWGGACAIRGGDRVRTGNGVRARGGFVAAVGSVVAVRSMDAGSREADRKCGDQRQHPHTIHINCPWEPELPCESIDPRKSLQPGQHCKCVSRRQRCSNGCWPRTRRLRDALR